MNGDGMYDWQRHYADMLQLAMNHIPDTKKMVHGQGENEKAPEVRHSSE